MFLASLIPEQPPVPNPPERISTYWRTFPQEVKP
jgi:hypothetical protein